MIEYACTQCKKTFERRKGYGSNNKFCSRSCNALFNVAGKNKEKTQLFCLRCGNEYEVPKSRIEKSKYCSRLCHNRSNSENLDNKGDRNPRWKGGIQTYRDKAWKHFDKKCSLCGSLKNLIIHHLNEDRYDNRIENLKTMCRSCHAKTHKVIKNIPSNLGKKRKKSKICNQCKKSYFYHHGHTEQKYCSRKCYFENRYLIKI